MKVVTPPAGYAPTTPGAGNDPAEDSSTGEERTGDLSHPGDRDDTLDFGFVPAVSVGDYVWVDRDNDGVQDDGEPGIAGVTLTLTGPDGKPVTDVSGNPVSSVTTDENGHYSFDNLPVLADGQSYTVTVTAPGASHPRRLDRARGRTTPRRAPPPRRASPPVVRAIRRSTSVSSPSVRSATISGTTRTATASRILRRLRSPASPSSCSTGTATPCSTRTAPPSRR